AIAELGIKQLREFGGKSLDGSFVKVIEDYYMTDAISRASRTMARSSSAFSKKQGADSANDTPSGAAATA
ncbi:hypothetical protein GQ54DRAFT_314757, partial [Martensiomyces pterosporus]